MPKRSKGHQKSRFRQSRKDTRKISNNEVTITQNPFKNLLKKRYNIDVEKNIENLHQNGRKWKPKGLQKSQKIVQIVTYAPVRMAKRAPAHPEARRCVKSATLYDFYLSF